MMRQQQQQQQPPPPPKPQEQRTMVVVAMLMMMCGSIFVSSCGLLSMVPVSIGVVTAVDVAASASTTTGTGSRRLLRNTNNSNNQGQQLRQQQSGNDGSSSSSSNSRYNNILQERVLNPTISDDLRGKTWKDLGIIRSSSTTKPNDNTVIDIAGTATTSSILEASSPASTSAAANLPQYQERRRTQEKVKLEYFAIYDEFGPVFQNMGDTAGFRGNVYNMQARDDGLTEEYLEGALQGTCSVVATNGKQLCSYELFLLDTPTGIMGTIVATGSVIMDLNKSNLLLVEATGDDFTDFNGGTILLEYTAIGGQTVFNLGITLDRR